MANTHKTNKARIARITNKKLLSAYNGNGPDALNKLRAEANSLGVVIPRYGNHRKMKAKEKLTQRRTERKRLNRIEAGA